MVEYFAAVWILNHIFLREKQNFFGLTIIAGHSHACGFVRLYLVIQEDANVHVKLKGKVVSEL